MYYIYIYIYIYLYIAPPPIPCRLPRHGHCPVTVPSPHPSPSESIRVYSPSLSQTPPLPCGATAGPDPGSRHGRRPQPPVRLRAVPTRQSRVSRPGHGMACRLDCRAGRLPCLRALLDGPGRAGGPGRVGRKEYFTIPLVYGALYISISIRVYDNIICI